MNQQTKLSSEQLAEEQQTAAKQEKQQQKPLEFATPEDMLRHDAQQTPVPPGIARRLEQSTQPAPATGRSWWQRLLGGQNP
jgi:hypothetical protein